MSRITTNTSVRKLPHQERLRTARMFDGKRVKVTRTYLGTTDVLEGHCYVAAMNLGGGGADVLVMHAEKVRRGQEQRPVSYRNNGIVAVSLAQIDTIEELT